MKLRVLNYPDKRLRIKAKPLARLSPQIQTLIDDMFETMYAQHGIGLAATQVNHHQQVIVMDVPSPSDYETLKAKRQSANEAADEKTQSVYQSNPLCFINPKIISQNGQIESEEGCLSVPDFQAVVKRAEAIKVAALDRKGKPFELAADGLLSICIQHEIDHLNGVLFVDYLSKLKQARLKKRLVKLEA